MFTSQRGVSKGENIAEDKEKDIGKRSNTQEFSRHDKRQLGADLTAEALHGKPFRYMKYCLPLTCFYCILPKWVDRC